MSDTMIRVRDVSMRFNLGIEKGFSIKQAFVELFSPAKREERRILETRNNFWALSDVNFEVKQGEVVGLIGTNGAGKSTLLKVVSGVYKPTTGSVEIHGNICPMIELGAGFDPELTAAENIFLNGSIMGYSKEFLQERFDDIVNFSELHNFMEVPIKNFSSGMLARLGFAIATCYVPDILIIDEILSVGDFEFQKKCHKKMEELTGKGATVLFVSHSSGDVINMCDRALWLDHGNLVAEGEAQYIVEKYLN